MKTKLIVSIAAILAAGSALASGNNGSVDGSASSSTSAGTASISVVTGPNQSSSHFADASAQNSTYVSGQASGNKNSAEAGSLAVTDGSTLTVAGGYGEGGAIAGADQAGYGVVDASAVKGNENKGTNVNAFSEVSTATGSDAVVGNHGGFAISGSEGSAFNVGFTAVSDPSGNGSAGSHSVSNDFSVTNVSTFGWNTRGRGNSVDAGGVSTADGLATGSIVVPVKSQNID